MKDLTDVTAVMYDGSVTSTDKNKEKFNFFANRRWDGDGDNCCVCNRPLKKGHFLVEIGIDGYEFGTTNETVSQGCWGIGPDCAKKYVITIKPPFERKPLFETGSL